MSKKLILRPSSIISSARCARQWFKVFIEGENSIPNVRTYMGTGIHSAAEQMWTEAIDNKLEWAKPNLTAMCDAAEQSFNKEMKENNEITYDKVIDNKDKALDKMIAGVKVYREDIAEVVKVPDSVEKRYTVKVEHPIVEAISGTVDYIRDDTISDIKTSKRKLTVSKYSVQQSIYTFLANANGENINKVSIQGIILADKKTSASLDYMDVNIEQAKFLVNNLLDKLEAFDKGVDPEVLFHGNPDNFLCNPAYCAFYNTCPFVKGK